MSVYFDIPMTRSISLPRSAMADEHIRKNESVPRDGVRRGAW